MMKNKIALKLFNWEICSLGAQMKLLKL